MERKRCLLRCVAILALGGLLSCAAMEEKERPARIPTRAELQPMTVSQCTKVGEVSFFIQRGDDACIRTLRSHENKTCEGGGDPVAAETTLDKNKLFAGPLAGNNLCAETLTVRTGSPCYLVEFDSGGVHYKICYHDNRKIATSDCVNHTGVCGPPHNP